MARMRRTHGWVGGRVKSILGRWGKASLILVINLSPIMSAPPVAIAGGTGGKGGKGGKGGGEGGAADGDGDEGTACRQFLYEHVRPDEVAGFIASVIDKSCTCIYNLSTYKT